ncbi:MAG: excisionase family DNA-binding protein [Pseudomonadota bacterium]
MKIPKPCVPLEPDAVSPTEASRRLGVSRTKIFEEIRCGRLRSFKCGARRLIPVEGIKQWISAREEETATDPTGAHVGRPLGDSES